MTTRHICSRPRLRLEGARTLSTIVEESEVVDMAPSALWHCAVCRQLYIVTVACDYCHAKRNTDEAHRGQHTVGVTWRPTYSWRDRRRWKKANQ